jgi:hypothetical protein
MLFDSLFRLRLLSDNASHFENLVRITPFVVVP